MNIDPWFFGAIIVAVLFAIGQNAKSSGAKALFFLFSFFALLATLPLAFASWQFWLLLIILMVVVLGMGYLKRKKKRKEDQEKKNGGTTNNFFMGDQRQP